MRYMFLLYVPDRPEPGTPEGEEFYAALGAWRRQCEAVGALVDAAPLQSPSTATTVRRRDGKTLTTDGPFAETTEWLGGYFILECPRLDDALELAESCPTAEHGAVEVRPIMGG